MWHQPAFSNCQARFFSALFAEAGDKHYYFQIIIPATDMNKNTSLKKKTKKTSLSSLSFGCQWELRIVRMSCRFTPGSVTLDADVPKISIFCAADSILAHDTLLFFIYLLPFLSITYLIGSCTPP